MEQLKYKVFEVLSRTLSVEVFEPWLYADPYVAEHITDDDLVLELMNLDYRSKYIYNELEAIVLKYYSSAECLLGIIELNCKRFLERQDEDGAGEMLYYILLQQKWDEDYGLIDDIRRLDWDFDLAYDGYYSMADVLEVMVQFSSLLLEKLEGASPETRMQVLHEGIDMPPPKYNYVIPRQPITEPLAFWKLVKEFFKTCFRFFMQQPPMEK